MNGTEFLQRVADVIDYGGTLAVGQELADLETWDSLGILSVVELLAELGVEADIKALSAAKTTDDLLAIASAVIDD
jgi:hypothetical protein